MINFVSATAGGIELTVEGKPHGFWASNAKDLASFFKEFGFADACYNSSTMDFASEEGFASDDDAKILFNAALEIAYNG